MKKTLWPGNWKVRCHQCGFNFPSGEIKKRWDGLLVCPQDYETRHPQTLVGPHRTEKPPPFVSREGDLTYAGVCDYFSSMGLSGYGTTGCARTSTYTSGVTLPPAYNPLGGDLPSSSIGSSTSTPVIYDPSIHDPLFASIFFIHNMASTNDVIGAGVGTYTQSGAFGSAFGTRGLFVSNKFISSINIGSNLSGNSIYEGFATPPIDAMTGNIIFNNGVSYTITITTTQFQMNWGGVVANINTPAGRYHWCIIMTGSTQVYIDGVLQFTGASSTATGGSPATAFGTGAVGTLGVSTINLGPVRWTRGIARYSLLGFTPPTYGPFPTQL